MFRMAYDLVLNVELQLEMRFKQARHQLVAKER